MKFHGKLVCFELAQLSQLHYGHLPHVQLSLYIDSCTTVNICLMSCSRCISIAALQTTSTSCPAVAVYRQLHQSQHLPHVLQSLYIDSCTTDNICLMSCSRCISIAALQSTSASCPAVAVYRQLHYRHLPHVQLSLYIDNSTTDNICLMSSCRCISIAALQTTSASRPAVAVYRQLHYRQHLPHVQLSLYIDNSTTDNVCLMSSCRCILIAALQTSASCPAVAVYRQLHYSQHLPHVQLSLYIDTELTQLKQSVHSGVLKAQTLPCGCATLYHVHVAFRKPGKRET